ncbi:Fic family protein [Bifidobacterium sp. 82T10]|uniref:Fic family protein n=1 Tax=Bifidobacterium miconis TaxID=2834435 RepID=A0ABS6WE06_9BIFI|nr:Fic family protein [Bifidobacterium miconis]
MPKQITTRKLEAYRQPVLLLCLATLIAISVAKHNNRTGFYDIVVNDNYHLRYIHISHAQFETIHPFADGNGRCGRALVHTILRNKGLIRAKSPLACCATLRHISTH